MMNNLAGGRLPQVDQTVLSWDFFKDMPAEREAYYRIAHHRMLNKKELLYFEGGNDNLVYYLVEGDIIVTKVSSNGKEIVVYIHKKGTLIGLPSAMTGMPRTSTARPLTTCVVYEAKASDFRSLVTKYPALMNSIMMQHYGSLGFMASQYLSAYCDDAETRLKKLLARLFSEELLDMQQDKAHDSILLNVTQDQIASAIGITRSRVNKILHRLEEKGHIKLSSHKISLVRPAYFLSYLEMIPYHEVD
jgi:CRP-like cAMP-binding protein